jgi:sec-independent protein translocase protein TatA
MLGGLGAQELLLVLVILALLFGGARVGELGGALGRGIREFRAEAAKRTEEEAAADLASPVKQQDDAAADATDSTPARLV